MNFLNRPLLKAAIFISILTLGVGNAPARAQEAAPAAAPAVPAAPAAPAQPAAPAASAAAPAAPPVASTPTVAPTPVPPAATSAASKAEYIGASVCLSCHQNREDFKDSVHGHSLPQAKGIPFEQSCETCHGPGSLHAGAAGNKSDAGFYTIENFKNKNATDIGRTCLRCHEDENRMHWVGSVHEKRNVSCLTCHSIHSPKNEKLLLVQPTVEEVCNKCHQDYVAKIHRNAHMPILEGKMDCTSCHNPHGSATPKNIKMETVNAMCLSCHADKRGPFLWEHEPVRETCLNCHDPHGSHYDHMLVANEPFLCQRCHIGTRHPATPYDMTGVNAGNNRIVGDSCTNCHSMIHGSNHPSGQFFQR